MRNYFLALSGCAFSRLPPTRKIIFSHCQDALFVDAFCVRLMAICFGTSVSALPSHTLFVDAFCALLMVICFGASISPLTLDTCFDALSPLSKNRVPLIMAHQKIKSLKMRYFLILTSLFASSA